MHKLTESKKNEITTSLKNAIEKHPEISFAYLHGSFLKDAYFRDIDIAVYLDNMPSSPLEYELKMESELMEVAGKYQVDVRILNASPPSFGFNVLKNGLLLIVQDKEVRADFQEHTMRAYFDFSPFRKAYLRETLGLGI